jgi:cytochrome c oxidase cbb3-type subunit 3/ubiquinol-cytochrome c reductase cytochrome c subunit
MRQYRMLLILFLVPVLATPGCERLPGRPTAADVVPTPEEIHDFAVLYAKNCAGCHGHDGNGNGALALSNPVYLAIADDDVLRRATAQGVAGTLMPPFARSEGGTLTDEQVNILVGGIRSNWARPEELKGATPPPYAPESSGDVLRGAEVYATFCASCHGAGGAGSPKGGSIVNPSFLALVSDQDLRSTIIAGRPHLGHPDWQNCVPGRPMTAQEVTDVVAWLVAHRSATPGQPYPTPKQKGAP